MTNEKNKKPFPKSRVYVAFGILVFLLGVLLILSPRTRLRYLSYPIHYLLGTVGFYFVCLLCFEIGLHLALHQVWKPYKLRVMLGMLCLHFGVWAIMVLGLIGNEGVDALAHYGDTLAAAFQGNGMALYGFGPLAGGVLGLTLVNPLRASGLFFIVYLVASILLALGILLCFWPLWVSLGKTLRAKRTIAKAKAAKRKEQKAAEEEGSFVIESEEPYPEPERAAPSAPAFHLEDTAPQAPAPTLSFAPREEKTTPAPESPLSSYVFAPAGGSTLPSRRAQRAERVTMPVPSEPAPAPTLPPMAPQEIVSPSPSTYAHNPVRTSGLQEAFFVLPGQKEAEKATEHPVPSAPRPVSMPVPEPPLPAKPEPSAMPAAEPKPAPMAEERPAPVEPAEEPKLFVGAPIVDLHPQKEEKAEEPVAPQLHEATKAEDIVVADPDDEEPYEPPTNDPIVLTPNPTVILTPETVAPAPEIEPEPAPIEEEKKKEDDDLEGPLPPYTFPSADLLDEGKNDQDKERIEEECRRKAVLIDQIFADFGVGAHVTEFLVGPSITRYSIAADPGVSVSTIARYIQDLEVRLGGVPVRFVERVLGMACSALEVANDTRRIVPFKEVFTGLPPRKEGADLHIPFGIDISGALKEADLSKFPHMLVAGTSGSGKSIFAHGILMSLVMRNRPEDLKLVLIDPKRGVEMAPYRDMPHLLCPIVKEAKPAKNALKKLCDLMDRRYEMFGEAGVRDIKDYNRDYALPQGKKRMSYIVVFVDEFADLVGECKEISEYVLRIAQKARACGIHLIVATQRPDVKVITGTIKSNLLCRVALTVASSTDSQTILGQGGAEDLYGYGDMLVDCQELSKRDFVRAQGCLATGHEMKAVCDFIRAQLKPNYDPDFLNLEDEEEESGPEIRDGGYAPVAPAMSSQELRKISDEDKYQYVKSVIMTREYCSISMIQREFEVGFPRAGKILARLQADGIVASPGDTPNNSRGCRVLVHEDPAGTN